MQCLWPYGLNAPPYRYFRPAGTGNLWCEPFSINTGISVNTRGSWILGLVVWSDRRDERRGGEGDTYACQAGQDACHSLDWYFGRFNCIHIKLVFGLCCFCVGIFFFVRLVCCVSLHCHSALFLSNVIQQ